MKESKKLRFNSVCFVSIFNEKIQRGVVSAKRNTISFVFKAAA